MAKSLAILVLIVAGIQINADVVEVAANSVEASETGKDKFVGSDENLSNDKSVGLSSSGITSNEISSKETLSFPSSSPPSYHQATGFSTETKTFWLCQSDVPSTEWTGAELRTPPPSQQHVAIITEPTDEVEIDIGENGTIPFRALQSIGYQAVQCTLRLEACADCFVSVELDSVRPYFTQFQVERISRCDDPTAAMSDPCFVMDFIEERADMFGTSERAHYKKKSVWNWPENRIYNSSSHSLTIHLAMRNVESSNQLFNYLLRMFPIKVSVHRNTEIKDNYSLEHSIVSPRYPEAYPRHMIKNYTIENKNEWGKVKLIFQDFLVDFQSSLRIFDSDGTELFNSQATHRRPPAILSNGPKLTVLFVSGSFTHLVGFRARFEFVKEFTDWRSLPSEIYDWHPSSPIYSDCDQIRENFGGHITLENKSELIGKYVDCIWIVGRLPSFAQVYDQVYIKLDKFEPNEAKDLRLEIRKGLHSTSQIVFSVDSNTIRTRFTPKSHPVILVNDQHPHPSFYIRMRGMLHSTSDLQLTYTLFYRWATASCPGRFEFHCQNSRCISDSLRCDNVDNCGDGSDEICENNTLLNMEKDTDITMLLAIVLSLAGIILALSAMIALVVGLHRRKWMGCPSHRPENTTQSTSSTSDTSQTNPSIHTVGDRRFYLLPEARINVIEAPPTYADALKQRIVAERRGSVYENGAFHYHRDDDSDKEDDIMMTSGNVRNRTVEVEVERYADDSLTANRTGERSEDEIQSTGNESTADNGENDETIPTSNRTDGTVYTTPRDEDAKDNNNEAHRDMTEQTIDDEEKSSEEWV